MKKNIIYTLAALVLATACSEGLKPEEQHSAGRIPLSASLRFDTKASGITPVVNSVRIVAFDGNGQCVLNQLYTSGWTASTGSNDEYVINFDDDITMSTSTSMNYDIFAVLNEEGYTLAGSTSSLSSLFGGITVGSQSMIVFNSYFSGKAAYSATLSSGSEPAFLMGAFKAISIPKGSSSSAYNVQFDVMRRSLAQVTVTGISSTNATIDEASIQIQEISLVNIPSSFVWGDNDGSLGKNPLSIALAAPGSDGFIARTSGALSCSVTYSDLAQTKTTDAKLYSTAAKVMEFCDESAAYKWYNNKADQNTAAKARENASKDFDNVSIVKTPLTNHFSNINGTLSYTETPNYGTPSAWTIDLGSSYYIPENISASDSTATCIKVRATIATPGLSEDAIISRASWGSETFFAGSNAVNLSSKENLKNFIKNYASTKEVSFEYTDKGKTVTTTAYLVYLDNLSCSVTASNITATNEWRPTSHVYDFLIPINNKAFDDDYSVRRGTKYTVTLHVNQGTYDNLATKACAEAVPFGISATVETEKLNGYED